jgi:glutaredoxin-like protein NrdH
VIGKNWQKLAKSLKYKPKLEIFRFKRRNIMTVTVYTLPSCVQCDSTKKFLDRNEVEYNVVDMSQDETALELVKALGYQAAPVVIAGDDHWSGFRPDMIAKLAAA